MVYAFFQRHLASRTQPDPYCVEQFGRHCKSFFADLKKPSIPITQPSYIDWLESKITWDQGKKNKYLKTIERQLFHPSK